MLMVVFTGVTVLPHSVWDASAADLTLYRGWAEVIVSQNVFPLYDEQWQYPPGAGALLVVPWLFGGGHGYNWWFFALVAAADAGVLSLLIRDVRRDGREAAQTGPWVWVVGVVLLGRVCYGRFDLIVAATAVVALLWATRRPAAAGAAVAAGVLLKVWPVVVVLGLRWPALWRIGAAAAGVGALAAAGLTRLGPGAWSFLQFQSERGLQIESVAATPLLIARLVNGRWSIVHRYGAEELSGPLVSAMARGCVAATVIGGAVLLIIWWRARPAATDLALAAVLLALLTSRVLSPQYLVWAVAVAAVCALDRHTMQRPVLMLVLATALVSQVEFPFVYDRVATGSWPGVIVLTVRNGLLLCATVWSIVRLCRGRARSSSEDPEMPNRTRLSSHAAYREAIARPIDPLRSPERPMSAATALLASEVRRDAPPCGRGTSYLRE
ncbi:glycosyltransferase 87 family protein [Nocardia sp. NBC_00508]|uniref:glycosyltransferase 87 family protein n=1 Tax=Nocardia sp. NBC_00508 TaxID=2975992 RepID=UPI002E801AB6|nr:glycosyltransferase 87 family protein [Nocardia sp. NBC_00508]WUD66212.1 glycosyltransferase 87 family protein [Nocardia sp. NBC_00508]